MTKTKNRNATVTWRDRFNPFSGARASSSPRSTIFCVINDCTSSSRSSNRALSPRPVSDGARARIKIDASRFSNSTSNSGLFYRPVGSMGTGMTGSSVSGLSFGSVFFFWKQKRRAPRVHLSGRWARWEQERRAPLSQVYLSGRWVSWLQKRRAPRVHLSGRWAWWVQERQAP